MPKSFLTKVRETFRNLSKPAPPAEGPPQPRPEPKPEPKKAPVKRASPPEEKISGGDAAKPGKRRRRRGKKGGPKSDDAATRRPPPAARGAGAHEGWDPSQYSVEPAEGKTRFQDLDLPGEILHAVADLGFQYCSPIQSEILPATLAGKDASGQAQTGTGKTAAFLITVLARMLRNPLPKDRPSGTPRVLVLAPTRELAVQIAEEAELLAKYCDFRIVTVFGGMDYNKQRKQLEAGGVDIVVATPGRLIDFAEQGEVRLGEIETLIIDEADRMLDMGFIPQVRRIVRKTPFKDKRQTLFFSATMTGDVERLAEQWTREPVVVEIEPEKIEAEAVDQIVYLTTTREKFSVLCHLVTEKDLKRVLIFCNRKDETQRIADRLSRFGVSCSVISGDIPQKKRMRVLEDFRAGKVRVLVGTDVAARGLHIEAISHVINYSLPQDPESYVHRIGRTGRAGATGTSISFACEEDSFYIPAIEEFLGHPLECTRPPEEWLKLPTPPPKAKTEDGKPSGKKAADGRPPQKRRRRRPPRKS
ncbi:MAG: DEAD/DEAH box helicase [Desulfococcaceae bacterium]